jgi:hypothetical protein
MLLSQVLYHTSSLFSSVYIAALLHYSTISPFHLILLSLLGDGFSLTLVPCFSLSFSSYRTHLSPGSRRSKSSGSRRVLSRATSASTSDLIAASNSSLVKSENARSHSLSLPRLPTPPLEPPALEQAWIVSHRPFSPAPPVHEQGSLEDPVQPRDKRRIHSHSPVLSSHPGASLSLPDHDASDRSLTPSSTSSSYSSPMPEDTYPALARPVFGPGAEVGFAQGGQAHIASSAFTSRDNTQWLSKREIRHPQPAYHIPAGHMSSHPFQTSGSTSSRVGSNPLMPVGLAAATREDGPRVLRLDVEDEGGVIPNIAASASSSIYDTFEYGKPTLSVPMRRNVYSATYSPSYVALSPSPSFSLSHTASSSASSISSGGISPVSPSSYPPSLGTSPTSSWSLASDTSRPPSCVGASGTAMSYTSELAQSGCIPQQQQAVFSHMDTMTVPSQPATPPMLYPSSTYVAISDNEAYTTSSLAYPMVPSNGQSMYQDHMSMQQQQQQPTLFDQFCKPHVLLDSHGAMRYDAPTITS